MDTIEHGRARRRNRGPSATAARVVVALVLLLAAPARAHDPHDACLELAVSPAFPQDGTVLAVSLLDDHILMLRTHDGGRSWETYGLPMLDDDVNGLAFSPAFAVDRTVFASTAVGGVWRSVDGGTTFVPASNGLQDLHIEQLAVSPRFPIDGLVLAVTPSGCFRSVDGAQNWTPANAGLLESDLVAVAFAPESSLPGHPAAAFVAGSVVHRSDDGGQTWTPQQAFPQAITAFSVSPDFGSDETLAICFGRLGQGVQLSQDGGASWNAMNGGLTDAFVDDLAIAGDGTMFAATETVGCFRASVPGAAWVPVIEGFEPIAANQAASHYGTVELSPAFAQDHQVFVASFEGVYHSDDAGDFWDQSDTFNQQLCLRVAFSPAYAQDRLMVLADFGGGPTFWLGGGGAPVASVAAGAPNAAAAAGAKPVRPAFGAAPVAPQLWETRASSISNLYTNELVLSPAFATDGTLFAAYAGTYRSTDRGLHWTKLAPPIIIARTIALSPGFATDHTLFEGSDGQGVNRSFDGGDTWSVLTDGLAPALGVTQIRTSPGFVADRTVFLSTANDGVFRSLTGGDAWLPASAGLGSGKVRSLQLSPSFVADGTLFAGTMDSGLFVSHDAAATWSASNTGLPAGVPLGVEAIAISPAFSSDHTLFVSLLDDGVFRSTNGGASWAAASNGLPHSACRALEISPDFVHDRTLLLSTFAWVWRSEDAGQSWFRLPGYVRVDDGHPDSIDKGSWIALPLPGFQGGGVRASTTAGDSVELLFRGKSIAWISHLGRLDGTAEVFLDGQSMGLFNLASAVDVPQARVFSRVFPTVDWHRIRVVNAGPQPGNPNKPIGHDGFEYVF